MDGNGLILTIDNLDKTFPRDGKDMLVLDDFSMDVKEGEFVCILGPSGSGKTTILRLIAGLQAPTSGSMKLRGKEITEPGSDRGMVFQEFALFPWRSVKRNVEFGLEIRGMPAEERTRISKHYIDLVGLTGFENSHPNQLSGGMKQRVGIARALASDPAILLMDEPFGALDAQTRNFMQKELLRIWQETKKTVIFVTHSVDEAVYLADRIVVLTNRPGKVKSVYSIDLSRPRDRSSPEFIELRKTVLDELEQQREGV
ncbi:ABC transporter ATP-binding protein [Methanomassiliicoccus luminyensis]|mgnify:CR=1 FL=1|jgi:NitT/TauT family transport system ATP-binding protein|uniref:ABC transporter ATP-binding protein n=1 Tax=Methanomassiliicoccus luminyensis TaxID=1080712 RepID=UPI000360F1C4|nr:ABC transporter ATP-binding protein [Methanomassiliicoccus luminyensis]